MTPPDAIGPLSPDDLAHWAALLPTVRVGGALPVTFQIDGDHVIAEVIVPFVAPAREREPDPIAGTHAEGCAKAHDHARDCDCYLAGNYDKRMIPLRIADGFPVPLSGRFRLPPYSPANAISLLREIVRDIYLHEIDEQLRVGDTRPFAPEH